MAVCENCNGKGYYKCKVCNGEKTITVQDLSFISYIGSPIRQVKPCYCCNGTGWQKCECCKGAGKIKEEKVVK